MLVLLHQISFLLVVRLCLDDVSIVLQLQEELEYPVCELDCPPGFGSVMKDLDVNMQSSVGLSSTLEGIPCKEKRPSDNNQLHNDMECIVETVQNELMLSGKMMLVDCVKSFIEEEVMNLIGSFKDKILKEVIIELHCLFLTS